MYRKRPRAYILASSELQKSRLAVANAIFHEMAPEQRVEMFILLARRYCPECGYISANHASHCPQSVER